MGAPEPEDKATAENCGNGPPSSGTKVVFGREASLLDNFTRPRALMSYTQITINTKRTFRLPVNSIYTETTGVPASLASKLRMEPKTCRAI